MALSPFVKKSAAFDPDFLTLVATGPIPKKGERLVMESILGLAVTYSYTKLNSRLGWPGSSLRSPRQ